MFLCVVLLHESRLAVSPNRDDHFRDDFDPPGKDPFLYSIPMVNLCFDVSISSLRQSLALTRINTHNTRTCSRTRAHIYTHLHTHTYTHTTMHTRTHHARMHAHTHTHTHTRAHVHTHCTVFSTSPFPQLNCLFMNGRICSKQVH